MKTTINVEEILYDAIAKEADIAPDILHPGLTLQELDLSSIDTVMMFFDLEEQLGIELDQEKLQTAETLGDLTDTIKEQLSAQ